MTTLSKKYALKKCIVFFKRYHREHHKAIAMETTSRVRDGKSIRISYAKRSLHTTRSNFFSPTTRNSFFLIKLPRKKKVKNRKHIRIQAPRVKKGTRLFKSVQLSTSKLPNKFENGVSYFQAKTIKTKKKVI